MSAHDDPLDFLEKIRDEEPEIISDIQEISETTFLDMTNQ